MGADLIFDWIPIEKGKEKETKEKLLKEAEKFDIPEFSKNIKVKIINSLEKKHSEEFYEFSEFWEEGLNQDFEDNEFPIDEDGKKLTNKEIKEHLKKVIEEFFECITYRDVSYIEHKGDTIYITGGMSQGDMPTDSYDIFNKFGYLPQKILTAGGINA